MSWWEKPGHEHSIVAREAAKNRGRIPEGFVPKDTSYRYENAYREMIGKINEAKARGRTVKESELRLLGADTKARLGLSDDEYDALLARLYEEGFYDA